MHIFNQVNVQLSFSLSDLFFFKKEQTIKIWCVFILFNTLLCFLLDLMML